VKARREERCVCWRMRWSLLAGSSLFAPHKDAAVANRKWLARERLTLTLQGFDGDETMRVVREGVSCVTERDVSAVQTSKGVLDSRCGRGISRSQMEC
jgi:hypothetical protein